jgi:hypothetical protein
MYRGVQVAGVHEYSDTLMLAMLEARRHDVSRERADIRHAEASGRATTSSRRRARSTKAPRRRSLG